MYINTKGLVLRVVAYKESSVILTVLTDTLGKVTCQAKGVKRKGSRLAPFVQLLAFSDMTLYERAGRYTLTEASEIEMFEGLRYDLEKLSLGSYFAQMLEAVSDEDAPNAQILSTGLNALYLLSEGKKPPELIKPAFEMRIMCLAGFAPIAEACSVCGKEDIENPRFDLQGGNITCRDCDSAGGETAALCKDSLAALRHVINSESKRVFSFSLSGNAQRRFYNACEKYVQIQLERRFDTLDYYKSIQEIK